MKLEVIEVFKTMLAAKFGLLLVTGGLACGLTGPTLAEIYPGTGVVQHSSLPAPSVREKFVRLEVPHIRQRPWLCVPTSSAMILKYFGKNYDPRKLKRLAEGHKPKSKRNRRFTYFRDMRRGLQKIGYSWRIENYSKTEAGFEHGLERIKASLRNRLPVMIDVHLGQGHTFVVMGFNEKKRLSTFAILICLKGNREL